MAEKPSLDGAWVKVERARENLDVLDQSAEAFFKRRPYEVVVEDDAKTGWNVVILRAERTPLRLSAVAGDVIHDLRSALDHLIWQLVIAEGNTPGIHNQFPIYADEGNFLRDVNYRSPRRKPGPLVGIDPTGQPWALIERYQPYQRRNPDLAILESIRRFSNIDKHRTLLLSLGFIEPVDIGPRLSWNPDAVLLEEKVKTLGYTPMKPQTELARLRFDPSGPNPQVKMQGQLPLQIMFGDEEWQVAWGGFDTMRLGVSTLLSDFEQSF